MMVKRIGLSRFVLLSFMLALIMGLCGLIMPATVNAYTSVEITGNGLVSSTPVTLDKSCLEGMAQVQATYSSINTWPTKSWYVGKGIPLDALFIQAGGIKAEANIIKVYSSDGFNITFTLEELLDNTRSYYPNFKKDDSLVDLDDPYSGHIPGSTIGSVAVPPMLALQSANSNDYEDLVTSEVPHLLFGQRYVTEQTNNLFVKYVNKIEVIIDNDPDQWAEPTATPASGTTVTSGTGIALSSIFNDADKVYFTTDGSDPSISSDMYNWIASRWWSSRLDVLDEINHPVEITGTVGQTKTIKALVIGPGRINSNVTTFTYTIGNESPSLTADITNNSVGQDIDITFTDDSDWRSAITGVTVNDSTLNSNYYTVTAGNLNIASSAFSSPGTYSIVVTADNFTNASVDQTINGNTPPSLTADTTDNTVGKAIDITFVDNTAWRAAITGVTVNSSSLNSNDYTVTAGNLNIVSSVFSSQGTYAVVVTATDYPDTGVNQTINAALIPPTLTADSTENTCGRAVDITFTDDPDWRAAITGVNVNGNPISGSSQYAVTTGKINIASGVLTNPGDYTIVVTATGYADASVIQNIIGLTPPDLKKDELQKTIRDNVYIEFTPTIQAWRTAIYRVTVGGIPLPYFGIGSSQISIMKNTVTQHGTHTVTVYATGYAPTSCVQTWLP